MFTPRGPVAGSFQHTLWPRERALEVATLVSRAFAFVFSWYKVIIALSLYFSSWALQHIVQIWIIAAKIVSLEFFFELQYFGPDLRLARTKTAIPIRSLKNADCWLQTGYKMQTENLYCFFVWYVITCHLTTYRASRNRFSTIIFHDYLHCCAIFLARFLITVVHNITSNLHIDVFSLCARVGWCDVFREVTNLMAFGILFILLTKMWTETKIIPSFRGLHTEFHLCASYCL